MLFAVWENFYTKMIVNTILTKLVTKPIPFFPFSMKQKQEWRFQRVGGW